MKHKLTIVIIKIVFLVIAIIVFSLVSINMALIENYDASVLALLLTFIAMVVLVIYVDEYKAIHPEDTIQDKSDRFE